MRRAGLVLLLLTGLLPAAPPTRLGALLAAYLAEDVSVARREELLAEIRRASDDDVGRVAAALRAGEHFQRPKNPKLRSDGAAPVFKGRNFRCEDCLGTIERSAGRYAKLILPPGFDPNKQYTLLMDVGAKQRMPNAHAVTVVLNPAKHAQAVNEAMAVEQLVLGLIAHTMNLVRIDPDRVFLRGGGPYSELIWYIGFQHPDRFAGIFCGPDFWPLAKIQAPHVALFSIFTTSDPRGDSGLESAWNEFGRFTCSLRMAVQPRVGAPGNEKLWRERDLWQQTTLRPRRVRRLQLVCVRPHALRSHWVRIVPKQRSRREKVIGKAGKAWTVRELSNPERRAARMSVRLDDKTANLVHVQTENVVAFQIFVDPALFDPNKALRVSINGGTPVARLIDPDIADLLDDYRERRDPKLLYYDRLSFP